MSPILSLGCHVPSAVTKEKSLVIMQDAYGAYVASIIAGNVSFRGKGNTFQEAYADLEAKLQEAEYLAEKERLNATH